MNLFKKLQNLNIIWRKLILISIMIVLAIGLGYKAILNFKKRTAEMKKEDFFKGLQGLDQVTEQFEGQSFFSTSTFPTSTDLIITTTTEATSTE